MPIAVTAMLTSSKLSTPSLEISPRDLGIVNNICGRVCIVVTLEPRILASMPPSSPSSRIPIITPLICMINLIRIPISLSHRRANSRICGCVQQRVHRDQVCLLIPTGSTGSSSAIVARLFWCPSGCNGTLSIRRVFSGQTWQNLAWFGRWDSISTARPRARIDSLKADSLQLESFRCSPLQIRMLLILSTMIKAFEYRLQSKGHDYDEQAGD